MPVINTTSRACAPVAGAAGAADAAGAPLICASLRARRGISPVIALPVASISCACAMLVPDRRSPAACVRSRATRASPRDRDRPRCAARRRAPIRDEAMVIGAGRDLRQMRHCQYLSLEAQPLHQPADGFCDCAADAGIDLVEDQRADARVFAMTGGHRDRERDARQLAAGGDARERTRRAALMTGDEELRGFHAERLRRFLRRAAPPRSGRRSCRASAAPASRWPRALRAAALRACLAMPASRVECGPGATTSRSSASRSAAASIARNSSFHPASSVGNSAGGRR